MRNIKIPENATNGEALCLLFPNMRCVVGDTYERIITTIGVASSFDKEWWNEPYKRRK